MPDDPITTPLDHPFEAVGQGEYDSTPDIYNAQAMHRVLNPEHAPRMFMLSTESTQHDIPFTTSTQLDADHVCTHFDTTWNELVNTGHTDIRVTIEELPF